MEGSVRFVAVGLLASTLSASSGGARLEPVRLKPPPWPEWVHRHWVWENAGTAHSALQLVDEYLARNIPVGAVIIDRPWQTTPNTFRPDPALYPDLGGLVQAFHDRDVRVMMWITSVVNESAPTFADAKAKGYFLSGGKTVRWWGGEGAFLDYTDPEAVDWWHGRMDRILDLGIDGWKCDGTDPFVMLLRPATGHGGDVTWADYRDSYYRDFFEYTRRRLGPDRIITARPCDSYVGLPIPVPFAPRDVNLAGWVGDQDGTFAGLRAALANMKASSRLGYVNFGSDIGGFRGSGLRDREVMIRWTQLGALCPVMENGGGGEHRPWKYGPEVEGIYRRFTRLHYELIPYLYSQGARSWAKGVSLMRFTPGRYAYLLGEDFFVAAMVEEGTTRRVRLPPGRWRDWFDEDKTYAGGRNHQLDVPLDRFPVFVRDGAMVPLDVIDATTGHGGAFSRGALTVAVYPVDRATRRVEVYEEKGTGIRLSSQVEGDILTLESSPTPRTLLYRVHGWADARAVNEEFGSDPAPASGPDDLAAKARAWTAGRENVLWIRITDAQNGLRLRVRR